MQDGFSVVVACTQEDEQRGGQKRIKKTRKKKNPNSVVNFLNVWHLQWHTPICLPNSKDHQDDRQLVLAPHCPIPCPTHYIINSAVYSQHQSHTSRRQLPVFAPQVSSTGKLQQQRNVSLGGGVSRQGESTSRQLPPLCSFGVQPGRKAACVWLRAVDWSVIAIMSMLGVITITIPDNYD